jgi:hypothetical protein
MLKKISVNVVSLRGTKVRLTPSFHIRMRARVDARAVSKIDTSLQ